MAPNKAGRLLSLRLLLPLLLLQATVASSQGVREDEVELVAEGEDKAIDRNYWSPSCPSQFHKSWSAQNVASVCFYVSATKLDWFAARAACQRLASYRQRCHGDLASVLNSAESDFVRSLMSQVNDHAWIGYTDQAWEGSFRWTDGRSTTWSNFYPGEPNNGGGYGGEHCVELMKGYNGMWNDRQCSDRKYYVCKAYCV